MIRMPTKIHRIQQFHKYKDFTCIIIMPSIIRDSLDKISLTFLFQLCLLNAHPNYNILT